MPRAGWAATKGDGSDDYEEAETAYRRDTEREAPIFETAKLRVQDNWYMWDSVRPELRKALELHLPYGHRSPGAQWLEVLLHGDELDDYALFRAREKLLELHQSIKPFN